MEIGEESIVAMAKRFGITTPVPPYPSINIGSADVYPIEMIAAYSTFATLGMRTSANPIIRVEDAKGQGALGAGGPARAGALARRGVADGET